MQNFFDWFEEKNIPPEARWLIFGKGPSYSKRDQYDTKTFRILSLNHVVREQVVDVSHMIDLDVVDACGDALEKNARVLVMPWIPHVKNRPGKKNLEQWSQENGTLGRMDEQGRLLWYNLRTGWETRGTSPVIGVWNFSSEAALNLLAAAGVKTIRSLGVDGGASYSGEFGDLKKATLLVNKQASFDSQFGEIAKILQKTGLDYAPLDIESPVRVYVAATEGQMLAVRVLEYSIRKYASLSVRVFPLHQSGIDIPIPREVSNRRRTPFSFQRFLIPECAGYQGRAIYMDSDMQVFRDIRHLWTLPFEGANLLAVAGDPALGRVPQVSVMLLDCAALDWNIRDIVRRLDTGELSYEDLMVHMVVGQKIRADVPSIWNSLEHYKEGETALIHYTDMETQPWVSTRNPWGYVWVRDLIEAVERGYISLAEIRENVRKKYVRPSLLYQVENKLEDPLLLPRKARLLDREFVQPFEAEFKKTSPWRGRAPRMKAFVRRIYQQSPLYGMVRRFWRRPS